MQIKARLEDHGGDPGNLLHLIACAIMLYYQVLQTGFLYQDGLINFMPAAFTLYLFLFAFTVLHSMVLSCLNPVSSAHCITHGTLHAVQQLY